MKTVNNLIEFEKNSLQQEGEDVINFSQPLAITDDSRQWNMTKYDVSSLDITTYDGTVTADHGQNISDVIGKVINLRKEGNKVLIDGIKFAIKENPLAVLAKNLMKGGFVTGVSIETIGDEADDTLTWKNHKLAGLSVVAHPNNRNAYAVIANSLQEAKELGLNTNGLELLEKEKSIYFSDQEDYNKTMNKGGNPYHAKDGKFASAPGSGVSSAKERYEKAKTLYENIDKKQAGSVEEKEYRDALSSYKKTLSDTIQSNYDEAEILGERVDEADERWEKLAKDLDDAKARGDNAEYEEIKVEYDKAEQDWTTSIRKKKEIERQTKEYQKELDSLNESPADKYKREQSEKSPSLSEGEKAHLEKMKEERKDIQKKIEDITKKFGNSISSQIEDNSNRLTIILNASSKGNPYHDKEGKFLQWTK